MRKVSSHSVARSVARLVVCSLALPLFVMMTAARMTHAQAAPPLQPTGVTSCAYDHYDQCALGISPTWSGLAVVRGTNGPRAANLYFLWPRDITPALRGTDVHAPGADSAVASARSALRLRRIGAVLTDASLALAAGAAVGAVAGERRGHWNRTLVGAAGAALVVSVPFHFAADGALSRAVWWHNLRYGR